MKKKIAILCLCAALLAVAVIGGTLAYFTDTDNADNTFTVGGVKIDLIEQQRNDDSTALEDFQNDKILMPIVGSAQGESETVGGVSGLPTMLTRLSPLKTPARQMHICVCSLLFLLSSTVMLQRQ